MNDTRAGRVSPRTMLLRQPTSLTARRPWVASEHCHGDGCLSLSAGGWARRSTGFGALGTIPTMNSNGPTTLPDWGPQPSLRPSASVCWIQSGADRSFRTRQLTSLTRATRDFHAPDPPA